MLNQQYILTLLTCMYMHKINPDTADSFNGLVHFPFLELSIISFGEYHDENLKLVSQQYRTSSDCTDVKAGLVLNRWQRLSTYSSSRVRIKYIFVVIVFLFDVVIVCNINHWCKFWNQQVVESSPRMVLLEWIRYIILFDLEIFIKLTKKLLIPFRKAGRGL